MVRMTIVFWMSCEMQEMRNFWMVETVGWACCQTALIDRSYDSRITKLRDVRPLFGRILLDWLWQVAVCVLISKIMFGTFFALKRCLGHLRCLLLDILLLRLASLSPKE